METAKEMTAGPLKFLNTVPVERINVVADVRLNTLTSLSVHDTRSTGWGAASRTRCSARAT